MLTNCYIPYLRAGLTIVDLAMTVAPDASVSLVDDDSETNWTVAFTPSSEGIHTLQ